MREARRNGRTRRPREREDFRAHSSKASSSHPSLPSSTQFLPSSSLIQLIQTLLGLLLIPSSSFDPAMLSKGRPPSDSSSTISSTLLPPQPIRPFLLDAPTTTPSLPSLIQDEAVIPRPLRRQQSFVFSAILVHTSGGVFFVSNATSTFLPPSLPSPPQHLPTFLQSV